MEKISKYMSIKEVSEATGVSVQAIHKAIKAGRIKNFQRVGYVYLINRKEVSKFKAKRES